MLRLGERKQWVESIMEMTIPCDRVTPPHEEPPMLLDLLPRPELFRIPLFQWPLLAKGPLTTWLSYNPLIRLCLGGRGALFRSLPVKPSESLVPDELAGIGMIPGSARCAPDLLSTEGLIARKLSTGQPACCRLREGCGWVRAQRTD